MILLFDFVLYVYIFTGIVEVNDFVIHLYLNAYFQYIWFHNCWPHDKSSANIQSMVTRDFTFKILNMKIQVVQITTLLRTIV